jgi:hypothetical protein
MKRGTWILTGTRFLGNIGLLARVLVEIMALTSKRKLHFFFLIS